MAHVVCLMNVEAKRATFTWSEGPAAFEPYTLDGMDYGQFKKTAEAARGRLADVVKEYLYAEENVPQATYDLAKAGYNLRESLFCPGIPEAKQVRKWFEKLAQERAVDTVEIVVDSPWALPWNVIYDQKPKKNEFLGGDASRERWKPFWGLKYNMCAGRKVDPLRRMPILRNPHVLVVVDPQIRNGLPDDQRQRLAAFADSHNLKVVYTKDDLEQAIEDRRPDLLYWLSHASPDALMLSDELVSPWDLLQLLRQDADDDVRFGGLAFLNACQTAEVGGEGGTFFEAIHKAGFAGMIGTEHQTIDQFANPLGLDFLEAFLDRGEQVGSVLRQLRGRVPLGLLYGAYCPPDIRVQRGDLDDSVVISQTSHVEGGALSVTVTREQTGKSTSSQSALPPEPYPSLAYYERKDRALFAGRDDDTERFATILDDAVTRILVLHGESGVGKSSFLHAGVIPFLEEECLGYRFIRDRQADELGGAQSSVIFIRATNDMFGQLAQALCNFCARPYEYQTPHGETIAADLQGVLAEFVGDIVNHSTVRDLLRADPAALGRLFAAISNCLPFTAILVIDQGEEVFTLAQTAEDQQRGHQALDMLRRTAGASGDYKVIFALRTEHYGRVIDRLRRGLHDTGSIREYLLTDFDEQSLVEAIRRPTADEAIPYTSEVPVEKYEFRYEEGVPEEIAHRVIRQSIQRRDSVLPLAQVICTQLYEKACVREDNLIRIADIEAIGGIEGGLRNHVEQQLGQFIKGQSERRAFKKLLTQLYLRQADGSLTTALLPTDELADRWTAPHDTRMPFGQVLEDASRSRLLRVTSLRIGGEDQRSYVSLGHDFLAKLAAEWDEELSRAARFQKIAAIVGAFAAVAILMGVMAIFALKARTAAVNAKGEADKQTKLAREAERQTRQQRDIARIQQQLAREAVDQMLTEVGQQQLADVPQMESVRGSLLNKALGFYLRFLDEQPNDPSVRDETARAYHRVGEISMMLGQHQAAEDAFNQAVTLFGEVASEFPDEPQYEQRLARSQNYLGELYRTLGNSELAEDQYLQARRRLLALVESAPQDRLCRRELAGTSYNLGLLYWSTNRPDEARNAYDAAVEGLSKLVEARGSDEDEQQGLARAYVNRGILNRGTGRPEEARQDYDRAIALLSELTKVSPKNAAYRYDLAAVLNNLGNLLVFDESKRDETERAYDDGVKILESLTEDFPSVLLYRKELANSVNSLAALYFFDQDFVAAQRLWQWSRGLAQQLVDYQPQVPENHASLGRTLGNLGSLMIKRGDYETARKLLSEAIESQQAALQTNPDHPGFRSFLRNYTWSLTEAHLALKDHESAARTAEKLPSIIPDDPSELYRAASLIARCVPLAAETPDREEAATLQSDYATRTKMLLARALDQGFSDLEKLDSDEAFDSVRDSEQFEGIRQRLQQDNSKREAN